MDRVRTPVKGTLDLQVGDAVKMIISSSSSIIIIVITRRRTTTMIMVVITTTIAIVAAMIGIAAVSIVDNIKVPVV